ncbi:MAG: hypothetical protein JSU04_13995 [Bdellovibrionales bacterium]|nr:hypothetical protein [Bdellovibrionales bacterium]
MKLSVMILIFAIHSAKAWSCTPEENSKCEERGNALVNTSIPANPMTTKEDIKKAIAVIKYQKECECYLSKSGLASAYITSALKGRDFQAEGLKLKKELETVKVPTQKAVTSAPAQEALKASPEVAQVSSQKCTEPFNCDLKWTSVGPKLETLESAGSVTNEGQAQDVREWLDFKRVCPCYAKDKVSPPKVDWSAQLIAYEKSKEVKGQAQRIELDVAKKKAADRVAGKVKYEICNQGQVNANNRFTKPEADRLETLCHPGTGFRRTNENRADPCETFYGDSLTCVAPGEVAGRIGFESMSVNGEINYWIKPPEQPGEDAKIKTLVESLEADRKNRVAELRSKVAKKAALENTKECKAAEDELEYCYQMGLKVSKQASLDAELAQGKKDGYYNNLSIVQKKKDLQALDHLIAQAVKRLNASGKVAPSDCRLVPSEISASTMTTHRDLAKQLVGNMVKTCGSYTSKFEFLNSK